jgi:hypothetical protein
MKKQEFMQNLPVFDIMDISHRGGTLGWYSSTIEEYIMDMTGINVYYLPSKTGVFCNYLGGGIRGRIQESEYHHAPKKAHKFLAWAVEHAKQEYERIENEGGLNNEEYEDGETNWDAIATNRVRQ